MEELQKFIALNNLIFLSGLVFIRIYRWKKSSKVSRENQQSKDKGNFILWSILAFALIFVMAINDYQRGIFNIGQLAIIVIVTIGGAYLFNQWPLGALKRKVLFIPWALFNLYGIWNWWPALAASLLVTIIFVGVIKKRIQRQKENKLFLVLYKLEKEKSKDQENNCDNEKRKR